MELNKIEFSIITPWEYGEDSFKRRSSLMLAQMTFWPVEINGKETLPSDSLFFVEWKCLFQRNGSF